MWLEGCSDLRRCEDLSWCLQSRKILHLFSSASGFYTPFLSHNPFVPLLIQSERDIWLDCRALIGSSYFSRFLIESYTHSQTETDGVVRWSRTHHWFTSQTLSEFFPYGQLYSWGSNSKGIIDFCHLTRKYKSWQNHCWGNFGQVKIETAS